MIGSLGQVGLPKGVRLVILCSRHRVTLILGLVLSLVPGFGSTMVWAETPPGDASVVVMLDQRASQSTNEPVVEQQLLVLMNSARAARGLSPLRMHPGLQFVARAHSYEMATAGYVGHGSLSGASALDRLSHVASQGLVGENVTFGLNSEAVHRALIASAGHRENILNRNFHRVGIGVFSAGSLGLAVTQDFAE